MNATLRPLPAPPPAAPEPLPDADRRLVAQAKRDRRAFALLYDRYVVAVYGYCYRRLGSAEAAEDATSLVFMRALAALPAYAEEGAPFRSWLFAIAHNAIVDDLRARRPDRPLETAAELADPAPAPDEQALVGEDARALRALLGRLTPDQARLLELRLAGLTDAEIARALGRSHGAVRAAQHRAVVRLRGLLGVDSKGGRHA